MPYKNKEDRNKWFRENWNRRKVFKQNRIKSRQDIINSIKSNYRCVDCGESDYRCLDFHHINDKKFTIGTAITKGINLKSILEEVDKCISLCSNCHRKRHFSYKKVHGKNKRYIYKIKSESSCKICQKSGVAILDFHHRNPSEKLFNIGKSVRSNFYTIEMIDAEISKCDIICSNCHRKIHAII